MTRTLHDGAVYVFNLSVHQNYPTARDGEGPHELFRRKLTRQTLFHPNMYPSGRLCFHGMLDVHHGRRGNVGQAARCRGGAADLRFSAPDAHRRPYRRTRTSARGTTAQPFAGMREDAVARRPTRRRRRPRPRCGRPSSSQIRQSSASAASACSFDLEGRTLRLHWPAEGKWPNFTWPDDVLRMVLRDPEPRTWGGCSSNCNEIAGWAGGADCCAVSVNDAARRPNSSVRACGSAPAPSATSRRMRNKLLLKLSWLGTHYNGWQRHCDEPIPSVYTAPPRRTPVTGQDGGLVPAGRLDKGVHAMEQIVTVTIRGPAPPVGRRRAGELATMVYELNARLPPDVRLLSVDDAPPKAHAIGMSGGKTYSYFVGVDVAEAWAGYCWRQPQLDVEAMRTAAAAFVGTHDFRAFTAEAKADCVRTLHSVRVERHAHVRFPLLGCYCAPDEGLARRIAARCARPAALVDCCERALSAAGDRHARAAAICRRRLPQAPSAAASSRCSSRLAAAKRRPDAAHVAMERAAAGTTAEGGGGPARADGASVRAVAREGAPRIDQLARRSGGGDGDPAEPAVLASRPRRARVAAAFFALALCRPRVGMPRKHHFVHRSRKPLDCHRADGRGVWVQCGGGRRRARLLLCGLRHHAGAGRLARAALWPEARPPDRRLFVEPRDAPHAGGGGGRLWRLSGGARADRNGRRLLCRACARSPSDGCRATSARPPPR